MKITEADDTHSDLLVAFLLGFLAQLAVVLLHQSSHLSVGRLSSVVLLRPHVRLLRAVTLPETVERTDHLKADDTTIHMLEVR